MYATINGGDIYIEGPAHLHVLIARSKKIYALAMRKLEELEARGSTLDNRVADRVWGIAIRCDREIDDYKRVVLPS